MIAEREDLDLEIIEESRGDHVRKKDGTHVITKLEMILNQMMTDGKDLIKRNDRKEVNVSFSNSFYGFSNKYLSNEPRKTTTQPRPR